MAAFSQLGLSRLSTCHPELQALFFEVVRGFDCVILEGHRNEEDQNAAFAAGKSKLQWPHGNHNAKPSLAVDVAPYQPGVVVDWKDIQRFHYFAGYVMGVASRLLAEGKMTYGVRWGGDWDMDTQVKDETFRDLVHFELRA